MGEGLVALHGIVTLSFDCDNLTSYHSIRSGVRGNEGLNVRFRRTAELLSSSCDQHVHSFSGLFALIFYLDVGLSIKRLLMSLIHCIRIFTDCVTLNCTP